MQIYDVTLPVRTGMPVWPGDPGVSVEQVSRIADGGRFNVSRMAMSVHTGTHVDAPYHFVAGGTTLDRVPLDTWIGEAHVLHLPDCSVVTARDLEVVAGNAAIRRLLLKTRNSSAWRRPDRFQRDYVALSADAARWIVDRGILVVGVDYLSIDVFETEEFPAHRTLLGSGVAAIEGLDLAEVPPGAYTMFCLPLKLADRDGAPARVVLVEE